MKKDMRVLWALEAKLWNEWRSIPTAAQTRGAMREALKKCKEENEIPDIQYRIVKYVPEAK